MQRNPNKNREQGSFRDPAGFVFFHENNLLRYISPSYKDCYDQLRTSGLYSKLTEKNWLIKHTEISPPNDYADAYKVIQPMKVPFVTYPYEWSFTQYKDASLRFLDILEEAINNGMILKDSSAYNMQFIDLEPVFIDTLSFEIYKEGQLWHGYKQFCEHFLGPLALMSKINPSLNLLMKCYLDGIPLEVTTKMLGSQSWLNTSLFLHINMQSRAIKKYEYQINKNAIPNKLSKNGLLGIISSLRNAVDSLNFSSTKTTWGNYYENTNYIEEATGHKHQLVTNWGKKLNSKIVWDFGGNTGDYSRLFLESVTMQNGLIMSLDFDPQAINDNYVSAKKDSLKNYLPLIFDITNPSPNIGWANKERTTLDKRGTPDTVMALALIHHLRITNNVPLRLQAEYFAKQGKYLIIEFVPKSDSNTKRLLNNKNDVYTDYDETAFETIFSETFDMLEKVKIVNSERTIYLLKRI